MSHLNPGLISAYNSLTDKHLSGYFNNTRIRRHLQRVGLITRSGRIVPDRELRHKLAQRAQQRHARECLAQAIFHKVMEMERVHQIEIRRKLEEFARRERVHKIKVERSKRYKEDVIHILSPRPPTGPRVGRTRNSGPEGEHSESSESPGSSRPNTAPGQMQRPARLQPIQSSSTAGSLRHRSPRRHPRRSSDDTDPVSYAGRPSLDVDGDPGRRRTLTAEFSGGVSPYCLPVTNNFVTPVPPPARKKGRGPKATPSGTHRGRRLRTTTAPADPDIIEEPPTLLRKSVHQTGALVSMVYYGKTVHLSHDLANMRDDVKVFQQHCGGENLCVYKGRLHEGESFQFVSRRHRGFPFSLTLYLNGLQVARLSSCCEFRHRKGSRLGGRHGHFGVSGVSGASPCYRCIIAVGLDKKPPAAPPKRETCGQDGKTAKGRGLTLRCPNKATGGSAGADGVRTSSASSPDTAREEEEENNEGDTEDVIHQQREKPRDDYDADFEADDEGVDEDTKVKQKNSPTLDSRKEKKNNDRDVSESEDDVLEEDRRSAVDSSSSDSARESKDETEDQTAKVSHARGTDREEPQPVRPSPSPDIDQGDPATEDSGAPEPTAARGSNGESAGWSELEALDRSSLPSNGAGEDGDPSEAPRGREEDGMEDGVMQEGEPERAKSVQEKLAEAILQPAQCSPGPELSDTSTEEEAASRDKDPQDKDAAPEKSKTFVTEHRVRSEEDKCEDNAPSTGKAEENKGEATPEEKAQEDGVSPEPQENMDRTTDKMEDEADGAEEDTPAIEHTEKLETKDEAEMVDETEETPHRETEGEISTDPTNKPESPTDAAAEEEADVEERVPIIKEETPQPRDTEEADTHKGAEASAPEPMAASHEMAGEGVAMVDMQPENTPVSDAGKEGDVSQANVPAEERDETIDDAEKTDSGEAKEEGESTKADAKEEAVRDESVMTEDGQQDNQVNDKEDREKEAETQNEELNGGEPVAVEVVKNEEDTVETSAMEKIENTGLDIVEEDTKDDDNKEEEHAGEDNDEDKAEGNVNEELLEEESDMTIPDEGEDGEAKSQIDEDISKTVETAEPATTTEKTEEGDGRSEEQPEKRPAEKEVESVNKDLNDLSDGNHVEVEGGAKGDLVDTANVESITEDDAEGVSGKPAVFENVEREGQEESGGSEQRVVDAENGETEAADIQPDGEKEYDGAAATRGENDPGVTEGDGEVLTQSRQDIGEGTEADNTKGGETDPKAVGANMGIQHEGDKEEDTLGIVEEDKEESTQSNSRADKMADAPQNRTDAQSGVEEDNRVDQAEASKPSEEGTSVVHKPQAETSQCAPVDALDKEPKETFVEHVATPEGLEREDNTVLVTNWITLHQTSRFFEKFVEPLDDWNELPNIEPSPHKTAQEIESTNVAEAARSSPHNSPMMPEHEAYYENTEKESTQNTKDESKNNNKVELVPPDVKSNNSNGDEPCESEATKDTFHVQEDHMVNGFTLTTDTDVKESTEAREGGACSENQAPSGSLEKQEEVTLNTDPELNDNQTTVEEIEDVSSLPKVEEHQDPPETSEDLSNLACVEVKPEEHEDTKEGGEKKEEDDTELTQVTDLTLTSMAQDDYEGDSPNGYISARMLGESINGEKKYV